MLRLPIFDFHKPQSLAEAIALKQEHGADAIYVAGGTDLFPKMKRRQMTPMVLISLSEITSLRQITNGDGFTIGGGVSLARVAADPQIVADYPALAEAASLVGSLALRNAGTLGGNLCLDTRCTYYDQTEPWRTALGFCLKKDGDTCWVAPSSNRCLAVSSSDCAPVAVALGAMARLVGPAGERVIPVETLYQNDGANYLTKSPDEILASIHLPPVDGWRVAYQKLRRRGAIDFPILGIAVALCLAEDGVCTGAKIVLGAVASQPVVVAEEVTSLLVGQRLEPALLEVVAQRAARQAKPLDNTDMSLSYRKKMVSVFIAGTLALMLPDERQEWSAILAQK